MVHFEPADEVTPISAARARSKERAAARSGSIDESAGSNASDVADGSLAPVTYLRRAVPAGDPDSVVELSEAASWSADVEAEAEADVEAEAEAAVEREHAEQVLLQRLRARSLSATESRTVLIGTEIAEHEIDEVIERFSELGYIDEGRLADQILHSHHERKGLGRSGVQAEMRRRGLDQDLILEKLEELPDDEAERAIELACKRVQQLGRLDDQTIDRRLTGFLMRKGYASSAVRLAVKAALASRSGSGGASKVRFR
ncbi:regulatory protein RecX [Cryobacterium sp. PH31-AA6]|uniref:regulatory protein RecX n=1 Tax=Cryobacterium sp. PH31-AA6 TaxID=3046205 RepID=UPI0024B93D26|nr:regulatory protein RecX [Cryobacterium sp. PH31-AA6]MDJ0324025.1 regulatory protein RecX [Cryobacterium sp. PH31-AA6]